MACDSDSADEEFYDAIEDVAYGGVSNRRIPCTAVSRTLVADEKPGLLLLKTDAGSKSQDKAKENEKTCSSIDITNADSEPGSRRTCPTRSQEDRSVVSVAASGSLIKPEEILSPRELDAAKNEKVFYENDIEKAEDVSVKGSEAIKMKLCSADQAESSAGSSKAEVVNVPSRQGKYAPFDHQEVQVFKEDLKETKHPKECQEPGKKEMPAKPPPPLLIEPDIVTSTKQGLPQRPPGPGNGPPRRPPPPRPSMLPSVARKQLSSDSKSASLEVSKEPNSLSGLVSPNTAVENLAQELCSLDLASLSASDQVVVAQEQEDCTVEPALHNSAPPVSGRPRSDSGRELTDEEILALVMVKNLDTGEEIPLSQAEDKLPCGINPLSLHIMQRTQEFLSQDVGSDEEEKLSQGQEMDGRKLKQKTVQFRKFLGKSMRKARVLAEEYGERAVSKVRSVRDEVLHADEDASSEEDEGTPYTRPVKFKAAHGTRGPSDFEQVALVQDLSHEHKGAVWTMKFSHCGRLLATAGQDNVVRIWVLKISFEFFSNMRQKYSSDGRVSPSPSQDSISSFKSETEVEEPEVDTAAPFRRKPFCKYSGHTADLLDLSWSKNYFLLSSSMDKTVRLWHISRRECLCCFQHVDFVTAIAFHPRDDRYFLSGSLDGKLRLWNIPEKKVALWNEVDGSTKLITAANFCQNGRFAVIGTYDGRCIFYETEHLKYFTQIHVRSTRGRNRVGRKITGIEPFSAESKVLVTSNDSRIRLYDLRDLSLSIKYKGCLNNSSQIRAGFSHDCQYIISGSEDRYIYLWKTYHDVTRFSSVRRDRNDFWEGIKAHNAVVTSAIFSPNPSLILDAEGQSSGEEKKQEEVDVQKVLNEEQLQGDESQDSKDGEAGDFLVTADFTGAIKVFVNRRKKPNVVPEVSAQ